MDRKPTTQTYRAKLGKKVVITLAENSTNLCQVKRLHIYGITVRCKCDG